MHAVATYPIPALILALVLCLAVSALGFRRTDYFVSLGYGFSIALQAVVFPLAYLGTLDFWLVAQSLLLLAYGLRLSSHLIARERQPSFARELEASKERSRHIVGGLKAVIWLTVSALYVAMYSPALISLSRAGEGVALPSMGWGLLVAVIGLGIESLADRQKSRFKAEHPSRFCDVGLYRVVRSPNYFGEMIFWFGIFVSGISAYASWLDWGLALVGMVCIKLIMVGSARRLELKQTERYGGDAAFQEYVREVPILVPMVPVYSLRDWKIYLG
jgi:steroid 5-alpha reductase family enzyme